MLLEFCRFCKKQKKCTIINSNQKEMVQVLFKDFSLEKPEEGICLDCSTVIDVAFSFKSKCLEIEDNIYNYVTDEKQVELEKILGLESEVENAAKICRTCLGIVENEEWISIDNSTRMLDIFKQCLPELALQLTINPVVCEYCYKSVLRLFTFYSMCIESQNKIGLKGSTALQKTDINVLIDNLNNTDTDPKSSTEISNKLKLSVKDDGDLNTFVKSTESHSENIKNSKNLDSEITNQGFQIRIENSFSLASNLEGNYSEDQNSLSPNCDEEIQSNNDQSDLYNCETDVADQEDEDDPYDNFLDSIKKNQLERGSLNNASSSQTKSVSADSSVKPNNTTLEQKIKLSSNSSINKPDTVINLSSDDDRSDFVKNENFIIDGLPLKRKCDVLPKISACKKNKGKSTKKVSPSKLKKSILETNNTVKVKIPDPSTLNHQPQPSTMPKVSTPNGDKISYIYDPEIKGYVIKNENSQAIDRKLQTTRTTHTSSSGTTSNIITIRPKIPQIPPTPVTTNSNVGTQGFVRSVQNKTFAIPSIVGPERNKTVLEKTANTVLKPAVVGYITDLCVGTHRFVRTLPLGLEFEKKDILIDKKTSFKYCLFCGRTFRDGSMAMKHIYNCRKACSPNVMPNDKSTGKVLVVLKCDKCPFNTRLINEIDLHIVSHLRISTGIADPKKLKTYVCPRQCAETFKSVNCLYDHIKKIHCSTGYKVFFWCINCGKYFPIRSKLMEHLQTCRSATVVNLFRSNHVIFCMVCGRFESLDLNEAKVHLRYCNRNSKGFDKVTENISVTTNNKDLTENNEGITGKATDMKESENQSCDDDDDVILVENEEEVIVIDE